MSYLKDSILGYLSKNKKWVIFLAVCLIVIFLSSFIASGIQTDGWTVEVTDLRDATNTGTVTVVSTDEETGETVTQEEEVEGTVVSGILFKPDSATARPASYSRTAISTTAKCSFKTPSSLPAAVSWCS